MAEFVDMPNTMWTAIGQAASGDAGAREAVFRKYRPPVLAFVRNAGLPPPEAEDLAHEVFLKILTQDLLAKADPRRGKFRNLLLAVTRNAIIDRRRRDASSPVAAVEETPDPASTVDDSTFDALWVQNLVRLAMDRLRDECERSGTRHFDALLLHVDDGLEYSVIAARLSLGLSDVKNLLHQARARLRKHVLTEMQSYAASAEDHDAEAACLMKYLG